jgi:MFS family permease
LTPAGRLTDSLGRKPLVVTGLAVSGAATIALGLFATPVAFYLLCVVAGIGTGLFAPAQQAAVADVVGSERNGGPALAASQMATDIGAIVGPIAAGALAERFSYGVAFGVTGGICLLAALWWATAKETLPRRVAAPTTGEGTEH